MYAIWELVLLCICLSLLISVLVILSKSPYIHHKIAIIIAMVILIIEAIAFISCDLGIIKL